MKQILQNMGNGETSLIEAPAPRVQAGSLLIRTAYSLISAGTERMLVGFGRASMLDKARQQPEKVRMVLDKVRTEGLLTTIDAVRSKLDQPLPLGYCNAGVVLAVGDGVAGFSPGDRVVSNGPHADIVRVAKNLCARIPDEVESAEAAFTVLAAIGLQGIRLVQPTLGEYVVVIGLGLIGLLTAQLLRAHGCHVLGLDFDGAKLARARQFGALTCNPAVSDAVAAGIAFSQGRGVDAVIITASTASSEPVSQAARMCRKRGRIVLVGVTGLDLKRSEFYEKELTFQVSCSYGPGRYDPQYEQQGSDYPSAFVRWTEQRNFEAVLSMMADRRLQVAPLITHRYPFADALAAYEMLVRDTSVLGIVLEYPPGDLAQALTPRVGCTPRTQPENPANPAEPVLGVIGAGNYASRMLIPAFRNAGAQLSTILTSGGVSAVHHGRKSGFALASTDERDIFDSQALNTVVVATRHDTHAEFVVKALNAGKHVFVEKPLALTLDELAAIEGAYEARRKSGAPAALMVGFNRRFAPLVQRLAALVSAVAGPKSFIYTVNAGAIPAEHWTQDRLVGGGRILGEACHFIDLVRFLAGVPVADWVVTTLGARSGRATPRDSATITLEFAEGSTASIHYLATGGKSFPKERLEVFAGDAVLQLNNFLRLDGFGWPGFRHARLWKQDKGQEACAKAFIDAIRTGHGAPIPFAELLEVSRLSIEIAERQAGGAPAC